MRLALVLAAASLASCGAPDSGDNQAAGNALTAPPADVAEPPANEGLPVPGNETMPPPPAADAGAIPPEFQGRYDENETACGKPGEYRLTVTGDELRFHESIGKVRKVERDGSRAVSVTADYQGEGESWTNVRKLSLSSDGGTLTIGGEGTDLVRVRCP